MFYAKTTLIACLILAVAIVAYPLTEYRVDINESTDEELYSELISVKGIGPKIALDIINYRKENTPITIEELTIINGIGEKRLKLIKKVVKNS